MKTTTEIRKSIKAVTKKAETIQGTIQEIALDIIYHIDKHDDRTLATELYQALPNGIRKASLADWFKEFGACNFVEKDGVFKKNKTKKVDMAGAKKHNWYEMRKDEVVAKDFSLKQLIAMAISKAEKVKNGEDKKKYKSVDIDGLDEAKEFLEVLTVTA